MTRKVVAGAAALALVASNVAIIPAASAATFSDVSMDAWYYDYVMDLTDMGIVSGNPDGTFRPDDSLNRAEMAKIAVNVAMKSGVITSEDMSGAPTFLDVDADQWFYSFVSLAAKNQILEGYRDANGDLLGVYGPGNTVNRAEASKVLLLAAGVPEMLTPGAPFMDVASTDWFYAYVTSAYNWSILDGYKTVDGKLTGYFGPGDAVTRAQISKIAVLAQDPVDRYTGEHLNDMPTNGNTNNMNTNTGTGSNMNTNGVATSDVAFEAQVSESSPARKDLALGTAYNTIGIFDFTAGTEEDVKITELTVLNRGFISDSLVAGVLAVDEMGMRHGNIVNFSDSKAIINFANNPIVVKAGTTAKVMIQMNFNAGTNESGTVGVELPVSGIKAVGASSNGMVNVMGSGLMSAMHALFTGANVGTVRLDLGTDYGDQNLDLGVTNQPVSSFKIFAGANEDIALHEITLYNNGTAADGDIMNLKLVSQEGEVLATLETTTGRYATFMLDTPYMIPEGNSRIVDVQADIVDGSTRTIEFVMSNDYDIKVKGQTTQAFLLPSITGGNATTFPVGDNRNVVTINEGDLTLSKSTASPSGEIANGVTETVIAEFKAEAFGEDIELQGGDLEITWSAGTPLTGTVRLMNGSGTTIHSLSATDLTSGVELQIARFNSTYTVKSGTSDVIRVVADIAESATNASTIMAEMSDLRIKKISSNRIDTVATTAIAGNSLTITTASMIVSKNASTPGVNVVKGATEQLIGAFNIKATNTGSVSVNSVKFNLNEVNTTGPISGTTINGLANVKIKVDGKLLGNPVSTAKATDNTFSFAGQLNIPKSETRTVMVYADVASSTTWTGVEVTIPANGVSGTAQNVTVTAPAGSTALQSFDFVGNGSLTLTATNKVSNPMVLVAGEQNVEVVSFRARANNNEDMRLHELNIDVTSSSDSVTGVTLMRDGAVVAGPVTLNNGSVEFSGLNQIITRDTEQEFVVAVNLTSTTAFNSTNDLDVEIDAYEAYGQSSGALVSATGLGIAGPTFILQNVMPVIAMKSADGAQLPISASAEVARFTITARGNETLNMKEMVADVSGSYDGTITGYKLYRVNGGSTSEITTAPVAVSGTGLAGETVTIDFTNAGGVANGYEVTAGSTVEFVLRANTTAARNVSDNTLSYSLLLDGTSGVNGGNSVTYTYDTSVANFATIGDQDALNNYPIVLANSKID